MNQFIQSNFCLFLFPIPGIISRLEYFPEIGVDTIWISPIYESPMADFGYDVSDFKNIDPIFGTLDDFWCNDKQNAWAW